MSTPAQAIAAFRGELGYHEGPDNATKYGIWIGMNHAPWCAQSFSWVMDRIGLGRLYGRFSACVAAVAAYQAKGTYHEGLAGAQPGDQAFYHMPGGHPGANHTELIVAVLADGAWHTIGGNVGDAVREQVRRSYRIGYGRPPYDQAGDTTPASTPEIPSIESSEMNNYIGVVRNGKTKLYFKVCEAGASVSVFAISAPTAKGLATRFFGRGGLSMVSVSMGFIHVLAARARKIDATATNVPAPD